MELQEMFESVMQQASVKTIFGEPISAEGKTIVPVATFRCGFGAGAGHPTEEDPKGFGGGGGFVGTPVGVVEITAEQTRFVPIHRYRTLALAAGIGVCLGLLFARRKIEVRVDKRTGAGG